MQYHDADMHSYWNSRLVPALPALLSRNPRNMADDDPGTGRDSELDETLAPDEVEQKPPPLYRVILLNDDYTPMEFVVEVLRKFFNMSVETATRVMLKVHTEGKGVCGVFPRDVAETKAHQVNDYARESQHPLLSDIEVDDDQ